MLQNRNLARCGVILIFLHFGVSLPAESITPEILAKSNAGAPIGKGTRVTPKTLEVSSSNKEVVKLEHKKVTSSDEKLGTSATNPLGYVNGGIIYDAPLTSGAYAGLGAHPNRYVAPGFNGPVGVGVHGGQHLGPHHGPVLGLQNGLPHHGPGLVQGQVNGYHGVVYGGHGQPHHGQQRVTINKQSQVGLDPYGGVQKQQTIQKTVDRVNPVPVGLPYSPYGNHGVVYMGNGLIPAQVAGVKPVGPVLPPPGYQQRKDVVINKGSSVGPYGDVHSGVTVKSSSVGGYHPGPVGAGYLPNAYHQFGPRGPNAHGIRHGVPFPQHQQVSVKKQSGVGVDAFGNVVSGVNIKKQVQNGPGLGYNGFENHVVAHTDRAIIGPHGRLPPQFYNGKHFSNPDPYFNNQIDPIYRTGGIGHSTTLLTTGPNKYYQGKNPVGVYERYHRLG